MSLRRRVSRAVVVAVLLAAAVAAAAEPATAPIVNGTLTGDFPAVGALVVGGRPDDAVTSCTGVLVGCRTFVTAAHCVCETNGAGCQGGGTLDPEAALVFFDHAGFFAIDHIAVHPDYTFPVADVAVIRLASPVTGIPPMALPATRPPFGTSGTIVGFGITSGGAADSGLKRVGAIVTAPCATGISDLTSVCWDFTGPGANTCEGDSGGPLIVDAGAGPVVAGVTSGGFSATCLANDRSYDTNLAAYREWIEDEGTVDTSACGSFPAVGAAGTIATAISGELAAARPFALHSVGVAPGTRELRVAMHASERSTNDFDLYVRGGAAPEAGGFDCRAIGANQYGFCRIEDPAPGSWFVRAERVAGEGFYQLVVTAIDGDPSQCGNGIREPGESCDGDDEGTCVTVCDTACSCVECSRADLDVTQILLAPRLLLRGTLGDNAGTYIEIDPEAAGVIVTLKDATRAITLSIGPRHPGWVVAKRRGGRFVWRGNVIGLRRVVFRRRPKHPTMWTVRISGKDVPNTPALDFQTLVARVRLGARCAERRFHEPPTPALPRE